MRLWAFTGMKGLWEVEPSASPKLIKAVANGFTECKDWIAWILKFSRHARCWSSRGEQILKQSGGAFLLCPMRFSFLLCSSNTLENSKEVFM